GIEPTSLTRLASVKKYIRCAGISYREGVRIQAIRSERENTHTISFQKMNQIGNRSLAQPPGCTDAAAPEPESENRALGAALCTGASASATTLGACPGEGDAPVVATEASQSEQRKSATTSTSSTRGDHCRRPGADTLAAVCTTLPTLVTSQSRITLRSSCVIRKTGRPGGETHRTVLRLLWVRASGLRPGYGLVERTLSTDAARGTILLTGGGLALEPYPRWVTLAAGKAALRTLAINLHKELLPEGIHIADRRRGGERRRPPSQGSAGRTWISSAWRTCGRRSQRWSGEQDAPGRHGDRTPPPRPAPLHGAAFGALSRPVRAGRARLMMSMMNRTGRSAMIPGECGGGIRYTEHGDPHGDPVVLLAGFK